MDLYITGTPTQEGGGFPPQARFFEPVTAARGGSGGGGSHSSGHVASHNGNDVGNGGQVLQFHLIVFDPASDSSLTPGWTVPLEPLAVPETISLSALLSLLRDYIPVRRHRLGLSTAIAGGAGRDEGKKNGCGKGRASDNGSGSGSGNGTGSGSVSVSGSISSGGASTRVIPPSSNASTAPSPGTASGKSNGEPGEPGDAGRNHVGKRSVGNLLGKLRRPKLDYARLYLTASDGEVVPLCRDESDWHFRAAYARVELGVRTETEWRVLKELLVAANGGFQCYVVVKGHGSRSPFLW